MWPAGHGLALDQGTVGNFAKIGQNRVAASRPNSVWLTRKSLVGEISGEVACCDRKLIMTPFFHPSARWPAAGREIWFGLQPIEIRPAQRRIGA